jgi:VanZ family protein
MLKVARHGVPSRIVERFHSSRWLYWIPVAIYAALIFFLSSLSDPDVYVPELSIPYADKIVHALLYGPLAILTYRAFRYAGGTWSAAHAVLLAITASTVYGMTDEIHQAFVPLRDANVWDLVADAIGSVVGAWSWAHVTPGRRPVESTRRPGNRV